MSRTLESQIKTYAGTVEDRQDAVTPDEVRDLTRDRDETTPLLRPVAPPMVWRRGPWPAVITAALVLVVFGVVAFIVSTDEPAPPADSFPPPMEREVGYYTTTAVPDGFVLQQMQAFPGSNLTFVRDVEGMWLPSDGGFRIDNPFSEAMLLPEGPEDYLATIVENLPGAEQVEVAGRSGVVFESTFTQDDVTAQLISVVGFDDGGGVFEMTAVGLSREEVLAIADGVQSLAVEEFLDLGSEVDWDLVASDRHEGFDYEIPAVVDDLADEIDVAIGLDLLYPRLAHITEEVTVVTTDDGEIVDMGGGEAMSSFAQLFLQVPDGAAADVKSTLETEGLSEVHLSPTLRTDATDEFVEAVRGGPVLSEDPHVIQAAVGPAPAFDLGDLGEELPLVPVDSLEVVPEWALDPGHPGKVRTTEDRPMIIVGTSEQPDSAASPITVILFFTDTGDFCHGAAASDGMGSGCGSTPLERYGWIGESEGAGYSEVSYAVPLETSVVQIITEGEDTYWQRPIAGHGVVPYGDTVSRPTEFIAFDAEGNEIGRW